MQPVNSAIGIADLLHAISVLQPKTQLELDRIARSLGFDVGLYALDQPDYSPTRMAHNPVVQANQPQKETTSDTAPVQGFLNPPAPEAPIPLPLQDFPVRIERLPPNTPEQSAPLLPPDIERQVPLDLKIPPPTAAPRKSLFSRQTARGLLSAVVMRPVQGNELDVSALIRALIRRRPLRQLPRLPRPSTRAGCQLLLDYSEALTPWWDDLRSLTGEFVNLLGEEACPVYEFEGNPNDAVRWTDAGKEVRWRPVPSQPVVVATDFGQIRPRGQEMRPGLPVWREFAAHCQRLAVPIIALTPLRQERCPKELGHRMALIHWNPSTRAFDIKRLIDQQAGRR